MYGCISSVHYVVLINGISRGFFRAKRGLRHGDPSLPFLFTIVADLLILYHLLIQKVEDQDLIQGFRIGRNNIPVSHLQ